MYDKVTPKCNLVPLSPSSVCSLCANGEWHRNGPWWLYGCTVHTFFTKAVWDPSMELTAEEAADAGGEEIKAKPFWRQVKCHSCKRPLKKFGEAYACKECDAEVQSSGSKDEKFESLRSQRSTYWGNEVDDWPLEAKRAYLQKKFDTASVTEVDSGEDTAIDYEAFDEKYLK